MDLLRLDMSTVPQGPWYRAFATVTYVAPAFIYTVRCVNLLQISGILFILVGVILTGSAYLEENPPIDDPVLKRKQERNPLRFVGPVILASGMLLTTAAVILCCTVRDLSIKQEIQRQEERKRSSDNQEYYQQYDNSVTSS